jgi:Phage tail assembly chaperone protein
MSQVIAIVDSNTLSVVDWYFADSPIVPVTPGIRLEVPEGLSWSDVKGVQGEDGAVTLEADPLKVQAKLDAQWTSVRAQQRQKLYESDWTCSVTDYEPSNKADWVTYRAALRDVTSQADPFNIEWPVAPQ